VRTEPGARDISAYLARLSHDVRTPLASIIGFADLLSAGIDGRLNKRQQELVDAISRNSRNLLGLINDVLDLSTIEVGQGTLRREHVPLGIVVADLRAATQPVLDAAAMAVSWPEPAPGTSAFVDRRRIVQALVNLIENARKHTPAGGAIAIEVVREAGLVRFAVSDSGPGIPEEDHARVFAPFFRRSVQPGTAEHGVGLGLAIVRGIAELHGGRVLLASDIGRGCRFSIEIPDPAP
jgi:two-component system, sensor histidine kinase